MNVLPALVTRPLADAYADALPPPPGTPTADPIWTVLDSDLTGGIPSRLLLDADRQLVLAVPTGMARPLLDADPQLVAVDDAALTGTPATARVRPDAFRPRLTLLVDGRISDTLALVPGRPLRFTDGGRAVVEVTVDRLTLTMGALRGPDRSGSRITLRWRDLRRAGDSGPAPTAGDPALPLVRP